MFISFLEYLNESKKHRLDGNAKTRPIAWKEYFKILKNMGYYSLPGNLSGNGLKFVKIGDDGKLVRNAFQINHHLKGHSIASVVTPDMQREDVEVFILNGDVDPNNISANPNFPIQMHKLVGPANARIQAKATLKHTLWEDGES